MTPRFRASHPLQRAALGSAERPLWAPRWHHGVLRGAASTRAHAPSRIRHSVQRAQQIIDPSIINNLISINKSISVMTRTHTPRVGVLFLSWRRDLSGAPKCTGYASYASSARAGIFVSDACSNPPPKKQRN